MHDTSNSATKYLVLLDASFDRFATIFASPSEANESEIQPST